jgi:hypothetical protein
MTLALGAIGAIYGTKSVRMGRWNLSAPLMQIKAKGALGREYDPDPSGE